MKYKFLIMFLIFYFIFSIFYFSYCVENANVEEENIQNIEINPEDPLGLHSETAVLMEMETGKILYDKKMNQRMYPASLTKVLTAIIVLENCDNLNDKAVASEYAVKSITDGYTTAGIKVGESFTIEELLEVMMLRSANEAATILAEYISGNVEEFSKLMNEKAKEIGAVESNFLNANGMHNENHYSTAYDMALIEKYCMQNSEFRRISALKSCSLPNTDLYDKEPRVFKNTHAFLLEDNPNYYEYAIGGKTGFTTPAKNCLITCAKKDNFEVVAVILHAEGKENGVSARYLDTKKLLDYGYENFQKINVRKAGEVVDKVEIKTSNGEKKKIDLVLENGIDIVCDKKEEVFEETGDVNLNDLTLPIKKGDILGNITYTVDKKDYKINLLAGSSVEFKDNVSKVTLETDKKTEMLAVYLILGLALVTLIVVVIFIIVTVKERRAKYNFS